VELNVADRYRKAETLQKIPMQKIIPLLTLSLVVASSATALAAVDAYKTPQGQVVVTGLTPGRSHGVVANTGKGYGVKNFIADACGEIAIDKAAGFTSIMVSKKRFSPKSLTTKAYNKCTKTSPRR
jgi:hypothetical protein